MHQILTILVTLLLANVAWSQQEMDFERLIRPLLKQHCAECHGAKTQKSGLRLDVRHTAFKGGDSGPVIVPGESSESELFRRITSAVAEERMPPAGAAMSGSEVDLIRQWIDTGAKWPESEFDREAALDRRLQHWAFQPIGLVAVPDLAKGVQEFSEARNLTEIDRFVVSRLSENGLKLNAKEDKRSLIRRITLDLTGLPATPERIESFVADTSETAWNDLVDELLASPRYGERWGQHWLDVIRYADTHGFEVNTPRDNAWHYRDYIIRALNDDKPYDQFIREQLAGDVFDADEATGFMVASAVLLPGQIGADEESKRLARQDALDEIIVGTSGTLLGLTIGCARCHDHKFDPITARDYYSLQAFFAGVEYGDRPVRDALFQQKELQATELGTKISAMEAQLQAYEPKAVGSKTLFLDEDDQSVVTYLKKENGPGNNPAGIKPGYKDETGSADRLCNISRGHYTWWNNASGEDIMTYNPRVTGRFQLWLSWGAHGSGVHTRDARYLLDYDGALTTTSDQRELATVDQYYLAGVKEGETEQVPLWSGLLPVGVVELNDSSRIILRGGQTGTGITADVIVLQELSTAREDGDQPAAFPSTQPTFRAPVSPLQNIERFEPRPAKFVRFTTLATLNDNQHEPCLDELEIFSPDSPGQNRALAAAGVKATSSGNYSETGIHQLKHINDGLYGNDHSWISSEAGGGWVQLELPDVTTIDRVVWGRDRNGKFPDRLPVRYELATSMDGKDWTIVARNDDRVPVGTPFDPVQALLARKSDVSSVNLPALLNELTDLKAEKAEIETPTTAFAGTFREPDKTYVLRRGDPEQRMEETTPAIPALFAKALPTGLSGSASKENTHGTLTPEQQRRLELATWIASPTNPLTARVMVNRIWLNHFGRGLVDTPSDFGINGSFPSHPELLDWLASEFIRSGWSIKHLHRLILQSAAYQQSSHIDNASAVIDRDNTLLWRFTSRRMESEAIRDSMLAVSGELNLKMGGPGFTFFKSRGGLDGFPPREQFTAEEMRRMIYSHKVRMEQVPVFGAFDCPDAGQSMPRRGRSTTAIQALNLFNSPFVSDRADQFAARVMAAHPERTEAQVVAAFQLALGRAPRESELAASSEVVNRHGVSTLCRVLFNTNEFLFIP